MRFFLKNCVLILFVLIHIDSKAQTWSQLENEYNTLLNSKNNDLALIKAKEMYSWVKKNESDTSLHLPISLKFIGNSFLNFNKDSALKYYRYSIENLKSSNNFSAKEAGNVLYKKGTTEILKGNNIQGEIDLNGALKVFKSTISDGDPIYKRTLIWLGIVSSNLNKKWETEDYYNKALDITIKYFGESDPDYTLILNNLGNLHFENKNYLLAKQEYLKVFEVRSKTLGKYNPIIERTLVNLGAICGRTNDFKEAESYYKLALEINKLANHKTNSDLVTILHGLGSVAAGKGDYFAAEFYYNKALDANKTSYGVENNIHASLLNELGHLFIDIGNFNSAEKYLTESIKVKRQILDLNQNELALSLSNLATVYCATGNFKLAEANGKEAIEIFEKTQGLDSVEYSRSLLGLGNVYLSIENYYLAEIYFKKSLDFFEQYEQGLDYAIALNNLAIIFSKNKQYDLEENCLKKSLDIMSKGDPAKPKFSNNKIIGLYNLASYYLRIGSYNLSEEYFNKALLANQKSKEDRVYSNAMIAGGMMDLYLVKRDFKKAKIYGTKSLIQYEKIIGKESHQYANALLHFASAYLNTADFLTTDTCYHQYLNITRKLLIQNFSWLSEKEKVLYWDKKKYFFDFSNYYSSIAFESISNASILAYDVNLISKSILLETSLEIDKSIKFNSDSILKKIHTNLKSNRLLYSKFSSEGSNDFVKMKSLNHDADSLDQLLSRKMSAYADYKKNFSITWKDVQTNLNNDEAVIEFVRYYDYKDSAYHYLALIVKQGDKFPSLVKLCSEDELKRFSTENELNDLYSLLWKPISGQFTGIKTIYYTPAGLMNNIPFQALYEDKTEGREYLLDKYSLNQLTSTRYLALGLKQKEQDKIEPSIALFGGINYNDYPNAVIDTLNSEGSSEAAFLYKNAVVLNRELDSTRTGASYLPGTNKEVETIADVLKSKQWQVDISKGKNATENKIKSLSGKSSKAILHIATHGFAYPDKEEKRKDIAFRMISGNEKYKVSDNPMIRSGLLFGGANITWQGKWDSLLNKTNEDGVLTAYELSQLDLSNTKLAVLSACETGKGAIQGSEGTFGLKRALKLAGVDNMIVSLWKVPDDATMEMMTLFYTELANTKKPVSSFETAQKAMRVKYPNEPKKWAGFVFVR
jgi:CHAT domain-containing protein/tetratricopeptide (TPR) repeat protein